MVCLCLARAHANSAPTKVLLSTWFYIFIILLLASRFIPLGCALFARRQRTFALSHLPFFTNTIFVFTSIHFISFRIHSHECYFSISVLCCCGVKYVFYVVPKCFCVFKYAWQMWTVRRQSERANDPYHSHTCNERGGRGAANKQSYIQSGCCHMCIVHDTNVSITNARTHLHTKTSGFFLAL